MRGQTRWGRRARTARGGRGFAAVAMAMGLLAGVGFQAAAASSELLREVESRLASYEHPMGRGPETGPLSPRDAMLARYGLPGAGPGRGGHALPVGGVRLWVVRAYIRANDLDGARRVMATAPDAMSRMAARQSAVEALLGAGNDTEALRWCETIPEEPWASLHTVLFAAAMQRVRQGRLEDGGRLLEKALATAQTESPRMGIPIFREYAGVLREVGRTNEAVAALKRGQTLAAALRVSASDSVAEPLWHDLRELAVEWARLGRLDEAGRVIAGIKDREQSGTAALQVARERARQGDAASVLRMAREVLSKGPWDSITEHHLNEAVEALAQLGRDEDAVSVLNSTLERLRTAQKDGLVKIEGVSDRMAFALLRGRLERGDLGAAAQALERIADPAARSRADALLFGRRIESELRDRKFPGVEESLVGGRNTEMHRAVVLQELVDDGRVEEALRATAGLSTAALRSLRISAISRLITAGRPDEARRLWETESLDANPSEPGEAWEPMKARLGWQIGQSFIDAGKPESAREVWNRSAQLLGARWDGSAVALSREIGLAMASAGMLDDVLSLLGQAERRGIPAESTLQIAQRLAERKGINEVVTKARGETNAVVQLLILTGAANAISETPERANPTR